MKPCKRCDRLFDDDELSLGGYCIDCLDRWNEQDREEPDGGAYREHQWT